MTAVPDSDTVISDCDTVARLMVRHGRIRRHSVGAPPRCHCPPPPVRRHTGSGFGCLSRNAVRVAAPRRERRKGVHHRRRLRCWRPWHASSMALPVDRFRPSTAGSGHSTQTHLCSGRMKLRRRASHSRHRSREASSLTSRMATAMASQEEIQVLNKSG